uniref:RING-type E3 ubiquitin transferase n=1 Tax=Mustela putorius furo TaxID=9669 RepID=M3XQM6_MUSPF
GLGASEEERYCFNRSESFRNEQRSSEDIFWDFQINILGEKDNTPVHFCDKCELPIKIYGRMIPCKHAFCYACAILHEKGGDKICPSCSKYVHRIEEHAQGSLFMCSTVQGCKRTYLSQRDLDAHINHRHMRHRDPAAGPLKMCILCIAAAPHEISDCFIDKHHMNRIPTRQHFISPLPFQHEDIYAPPAEFVIHSFTSTSFSESGNLCISTRKHSNLMTQILHHPEYQRQPVVLNSPHIIPPEKRFVVLSPPPPVSHRIPHQIPPEGLPMTSSPAPSPHIIAQILPYMKYLPPGPVPLQTGSLVSTHPSHHCNSHSLLQVTESEGTQSPQFIKLGERDMSIWPADRGPRLPGLSSQTLLSGLYHPDQTRYMSYYQ